MPNRRVGRVIYHKIAGKWRKKQTCGSVEAAKKALRLLNAIQHGFVPMKRREKR